MSYTSDINKVTRTEESPEFPKVILLDNTSACNLRCAMCDHQNIRNYRKIQTMPMDIYQKIINEIAVENPAARVWQIFFGDPFLCKDMPERIQYAKAKGLQDVVVNTNGVLMTPEKSRAYIEAGLDAIYVGIDAETSQTYDSIRIGGNFKEAVAHVLAYRDALKAWGSVKQQLFVQFVVSEQNESELEDFKIFWLSEGVQVKIRPKISWAGLINAHNLQTNDVRTRKPCYWLMQTMNICADGRVALCSVDLHCRVSCGDVTSSTIKDIWKNGCLHKYRKMHTECCFDDLPEMCQNCQDWQSAYADYAQN